MRLGRVSCVSAVLAAVLSSGIAWAQNGTVSGTVTDSTGAGVSGAEVRVDGTTIHTQTDAQGRYELTNVPPGPHTIRALQLGYRAATRPVTLDAGATLTVDLHLERTVIPVQGVEILI